MKSLLKNIKFDIKKFPQLLKKEFNGFENYSLLDNAHLTRGRPNRLASASCSPDCVFMQCKATLLCYFQKISSILSCHQAVHRLQITQLQISPPPITAPLSLLLLLVQQGGSKIFFFLFSRRPLGGVQQQQSCIFSPPPSRELLTSHTLYHHLPCIKVKNWLISKILFCFVLLVFTSYYFCENWKWLSPNIIVVVVCRFFFNT